MNSASLSSLRKTQPLGKNRTPLLLKCVKRSEAISICSDTCQPFLCAPRSCPRVIAWTVRKILWSPLWDTNSCGGISREQFWNFEFVYIWSDMYKCSFGENRKASLKCVSQKVRQGAAMLQKYLHVGCCECVRQQKTPSFSHSGIRQTAPSLYLFVKLPSFYTGAITLIYWSYRYILLDKFLLISLLGTSFIHAFFPLLICTMQPFSAGYTQATVMFYVNCTNRGLPRILWELSKDTLYPG